MSDIITEVAKCFSHRKERREQYDIRRSKKTGKNFKVVPVSKEIAEGEKTPMEVLRKLKKVSTQCYLLESVEKQKKRGRYTFLGFEPEAEVTCIDGKVVIQKKRQKP